MAIAGERGPQIGNQQSAASLFLLQKKATQHITKHVKVSKV